MARGPHGECRPDDPNEVAVMVAKIATGQLEEVTDKPRQRVVFSGVVDDGPKDNTARADRAVADDELEPRVVRT